MTLPAQKDKRYTYAEYLTWSEDERWELLDGVAYNLAAPSRRYQEVLSGLFYQIRSYLADKLCRIYTAPFDVRLSESGGKNEQINHVVQPDISVICDESRIKRGD